MKSVPFQNSDALFLRAAASEDNGRNVRVSVGTVDAEIFTILFRGRFSGLLYSEGADETLHVISSMWPRRLMPALIEYVGAEGSLESMRGKQLVCEGESHSVESA